MLQCLRRNGGRSSMGKPDENNPNVSKLKFQDQQTLLLILTSSIQTRIKMLSSNLRAVARRYVHSTRILSNRGPLSFEGWYPRDHKPGALPVNDVERKAAAMKYGLRPEDYHPMDKDDVIRYAGDYPDLGIVTYDHKDPYENWTDSQNRRNWGEMVGIDMMRYRGDRLTFTGLEAEDYTTWGSIVLCLRVLVPMALIAWYFCNDHPNALRWRNPAMPKQYPYDFYRAYPFDDARRYPVVNYSFELEE